MEGVGIKIKSMSLVIYTMICSWTNIPEEQPNEAKEGLGRDKGAKEF